MTADAAEPAPDPEAPLELRPVPRDADGHERAYQVVLAAVEQAVLEGRVAVGDKLPPEREMAAQLSVSRTAVREAMRALEAMGVVTAGVGRDGGTVLTSFAAGALTQWLRLHVMLGNFPMDDVVETRVMFERQSAALAAQQATPEQLEALDTLLREMEEPAIDPARFNALDTAFHVALAEATGNHLVAEFTTSVRTSMENAISVSLTTQEAWLGSVEVLRAQHRAILDAVRAREAERAADLMEAHIRSAYDALAYRDARRPRLR